MVELSADRKYAVCGGSCGITTDMFKGVAYHQAYA